MLGREKEGYNSASSGLHFMVKVQVRHLIRKSTGVYYYQRRVPLDLRQHFQNKIFIRRSLHTQDLSLAASLIPPLEVKDDALFASLRGSDPPKPNVEAKAKSAPPITLSTACSLYLSEHRNAGDPRFTRDTQRAIDFVIEKIGDLPLGSYTREHSRLIRDALMPGHITSTVRRRLEFISAVFNMGRREFDIQCLNPFERLTIPSEGIDVEKRDPFNVIELQLIASACHKADDDIRYIVAIQLATGARLGEIVGLRKSDVFLDPPVPFIFIRPHLKLGRSLKTPGSERQVPLVGIGLWAACQAVQPSKDTSGWLFPRYASDGSVLATHASNTINKFLRETLNIPKTSHSFRHSMKDNLRNSGCPEPIQRQLLGHGARSVADSYGQGYSLPVLQSHLDKAYGLIFPKLDIRVGDSWALPSPDPKKRLPS